MNTIDSEQKKIILKQLSDESIKVQIGVVDNILIFTMNDHSLAIKILKYISSFNNKKITISAFEKYMNFYDAYECDSIIKKFFLSKKILNNAEFLKEVKDKNLFLFYISLINSSNRIIIENAKKTNTFLSNFNNDVLLDFINVLFTALKSFKNEFIFDSNVLWNFLEKYINMNLKNIEKYKNTKVYEIFADQITYI